MTDYIKIANLLVQLQPADWKKIVLYAQITRNSYELFFYTKIGSKYVQNFDFEKKYGITRKEFRDCFKKIYEELLPDHIENKWYVCTFILDYNGQFTTEYEYNDISEDFLHYKQFWKDKYIHN